ncbi:MAG: hypothetical protein IKP68_08050 [Clostridia bacterium]|nr:hypothetical protein [Clostridia bacterium]
MPAPMANMQGMIQRFRQFAQGFRGNPQQQVQNLLNSGQMSQDQYNRLRQMAQQFQGMLK